MPFILFVLFVSALILDALLEIRSRRATPATYVAIVTLLILDAGVILLVCMDIVRKSA